MTSLVHLPSCISAALLFFGISSLPNKSIRRRLVFVRALYFDLFSFSFLVWLPFFDLSFRRVAFSATGDELFEVRVSILSIEGASSFFSRPFLRQTFFLFSFLFSNRVPASAPHPKTDPKH